MEIIILFFLILLNGFFALSEIALVSSNKNKLKSLHNNGNTSAGVALKLYENSENFLSAIQVGITLIGIVTGVYGGMNLADDVTPFFSQFSIIEKYAYEIALSITVIIITFFSIVLGELVPKTIALSNSEKIACIVAPIIYYFTKIFYPFVTVLTVSTNLINKILGVKKQNDQLTETELRLMIKIASHEGVIEKEQNDIHEKVFYFSDKRAKHIMTHRTDVDWIDITKEKSEINKQIQDINHSKIVCSKGDLDNFIGILYAKDYYMACNSQTEFDIESLLVKPLIIPENTVAQKVLTLFRQKQNHFSIVVNEYGGFEGIITPHDIMENIIGDIPEEGEIYEPDVFVRDDNSILVSGDAPIETLVNVIEDFTIDFDKIDYATVAGFVFYEINKIPEIGDKFEYNGYTIEIIDIDANRIDKILIIKN